MIGLGFLALFLGWQAPSSSTTVQPVVLTYFIADASGSSGVRPADRELASWAVAAWQRNAPKGLRLEPAAESDALIRVYWTESGDGRYGEMQPLDVHGKRGAAVFIQPDVGALDQAIARRAATDDLLRDTVVYLTCLHEFGHALGLAHTRDFRDIMYFFGFGGDIVEYFDRYRRQLYARPDIARVSGLSANDIHNLAEVFSR